jgi:hypothetical protein
MSTTMILWEWTVSCPLLAAEIRLAGHWFPAFQSAVCQQRSHEKAPLENRSWGGAVSNLAKQTFGAGKRQRGHGAGQ